MTTDYTKLLSKLIPEAGGEDTARLRTMVVSSVNSDGTVNLSTSGVIIPNIPRLSNAAVIVGEPVQVLTIRGSAIVLGPVAAGVGGAFGWRPIASGSLAGQSQVSISVPVGVYSQLKLTLVGTRATSSGAGEIWCRVNNVSSSVYQTGRVNFNPASGNMTNNYHDTHGNGFVLAFWTSTDGTNTYGTATGLFLATDDPNSNVNFEGQFSRQGATPNVGFTGGRTTSNLAVSSLQIRTEGAVNFASNSRYWLEGYIG